MRNSEDRACGEYYGSLRLVGLGSKARRMPKESNISIRKEWTKEKPLLAVK